MRTIGLKPDDRVLLIERREDHELVHNALVLGITMNERLAGPQGHMAIDVVLVTPQEWNASPSAPRFVSLQDVRHISHPRWREKSIGFAYEELPPQSGVCRYCGCTENRACTITLPAGDAAGCLWIDVEKTVCSSAMCLEKALEDGAENLMIQREQC